MDKPFEEICPNCKGEDLEYDVYEPQDEFMTQEVTCKECGLTFKIWCEPKWMYTEE